MKRPYLLSIIAGLFLVIGIITINDYGITWDEPENFMMGRIYLNAYIHPFSHILAHPNALPLPPAVPFRLEAHYERYPPFADTVASVTSFVLSERLHILNTIAAHHAAALLFATAGIIATGLIAWELTASPVAVVIAALTLALYPLYIGLAHTDIKDIPGAAMFTVAMYWIIRTLKKPSYKNSVLAGVCWGLAIATKVTAAFAPLIAVIWFLLTMRTRSRWSVPQIINTSLIFLLAGGCSLIAAWPWLMTDTLAHLLLVYKYISAVGRGLPVLFAGRIYHAGIDTPWYYAPVSLAVVTPLPMLAAACIGIGVGVKTLIKRTGETALWSLPVLWLAIVFARYLSPTVTVYNGIRHFMEAVPAIAILASLGGLRLTKFFRNLSAYTPVVYYVLLTLLIPTIINDIRLHPYEMLYFNRLTGGIKQASTSYEFDYWGFSAAELVKKVNALPGTTGKTVNINWLDFPSWYFPDNRLVLVPSNANPDYVIVPHSVNYFSGAKSYLDLHSKRVYTIVREDAEVGYLYQMTP